MPPIIPGGPTTYGMSTRAAYGGGSNPTIIRVTSRANAGPGTLREAVDATGPRVVIFEVAGYIDISTNIIIRNPYITIAGQTAPSPGVTIRMVPGGSEAMIMVSTHDVFIQHIRIRPGDNTCNSAMQVYGGQQQYIVLDHVSMSWGQDDNLALNWTNGQSTDMTIWRCIFSEGLLATPIGDTCTGGGRSNGHAIYVGPSSGGTAMIQNLMSCNMERNPYMLADTQTAIMNNIIYQWHGPWGFFFNNGGVSGGSTGGPWFCTAMGNRFIQGPYTHDPPGQPGNDPVAYMFLYSINGVSNSPTTNRIYKNDNTLANDDGRIVFESNQYPYNPNVGSPPAQAPVPTNYAVLPSNTLETWLLGVVGCRPLDRDAVDARIVANVTHQGGNFITYVSEVGGYPTLANTSRALVTPNSPHVDSGNGYTNLEVWLQQYAQAVEGGGAIPDAGPPDPGPASGAQFLFDPCTGTAGTALTAHAPTIGGTWTRHPTNGGVLVISSTNKVRNTTVNDSALTFNTALPITGEYDVSANLMIYSLTPGSSYTVWARTDPVLLTGYFFGVDVDSATGSLWVVLNGVFTALGSGPVNLSPGNHQLSIRVRNATKHGLWDNVVVTGSTDNSVTGAGRAAISVYAPSTADADGAGIQFDDLVAFNLGGGTPLSGVQSRTFIGAAVNTTAKAATGSAAGTTVQSFSGGRAGRTVALSGVAAQTFTGSFFNIRAPVSITAVVQAGTLGLVRSKGLSGIETLGATGAVVPSSVSAPLRLTSATATAQTGLLALTATGVLTGSGVSALTGSLSQRLPVAALTGVQGTTGQGAVTAPGAVTVPLVGLRLSPILNFVLPPATVVIKDPITDVPSFALADALYVGTTGLSLSLRAPGDVPPGLVITPMLAGWTINDPANNPGTMTFEVLSVDGVVTPTLDAEVYYMENGVRIFGGLIRDVEVRGAGDEGGTPLVSHVTAIDFNSLASRRYFAYPVTTSPAGTLKSILQQLMVFIPGAMLDATQADGPTLPPVDYGQYKMNEILQNLTERTGWLWNIDYYRILSMKPPGALAAPFTVTVGDPNIVGDVTVEPSRANFANLVLVIGQTREIYAYSLDAASVAVSGYYELLINAPDFDTIAKCKALADLALSQSLPVLKTARYRTLHKGLKSSMTQTITLPGRGINNIFILNEVVTRYFANGQSWREVVATEGLVYQTGWRESLTDFFIQGRAGGMPYGGGTTVAPTSTGVRVPYTIGGNGTEAVYSPTAGAWVPAAGGGAIGNATVQPQINTIPRGGTDATLTLRLRALSPGVSVTARLFDVTTGQSTPGQSAPVVSTGPGPPPWVNVSYATMLTPGSHFYELHLLGSVPGELLQATGYVE